MKIVIEQATKIRRLRLSRRVTYKMQDNSEESSDEEINSNSKKKGIL